MLCVVWLCGMGEVFEPLKTWSKFILTSDEAFESKYGSQADKKRKLYNGTLKVDLYQYFGQRVKRQDVKVERNANE